MSGLEVIGAISSAGSVVEACLSIWKFLDTFVQKVAEADAVAQDLQSKIDQLRVCCQSVQRTGRSWKRRTAAEAEADDRDEVTMWATINKTLRQCENIFRKFEEALEGLDNGKENTWLNAALLQRRMDKREPRIARLEKKIDLQLSTLNILILSAHLYVFSSTILSAQSEMLTRAV